MLELESLNNKIKLFIRIRKAYAYKNAGNMINMIMLGCFNLIIPLPNGCESGLKVAKVKALTCSAFNYLPILMHEEPLI